MIGLTTIAEDQMHDDALRTAGTIQHGICSREVKP
jgi:hypothetical protein